MVRRKDRGTTPARQLPPGRIPASGQQSKQQSLSPSFKSVLPVPVHPPFGDLILARFVLGLRPARNTSRVPLSSSGFAWARNPATIGNAAVAPVIRRLRPLSNPTHTPTTSVEEYATNHASRQSFEVPVFPAIAPNRPPTSSARPVPRVTTPSRAEVTKRTPLGRSSGHPSRSRSGQPSWPRSISLGSGRPTETDSSRAPESGCSRPGSPGEP